MSTQPRTTQIMHSGEALGEDRRHHRDALRCCGSSRGRAGGGQPWRADGLHRSVPLNWITVPGRAIVCRRCATLLPKAASPTRLAVISTATIDAFRNSAAKPGRLGEALGLGPMSRLAGRSYRATCVVDLLCVPVAARHYGPCLQALLAVQSVATRRRWSQLSRRPWTPLSRSSRSDLARRTPHFSLVAAAGHRRPLCRRSTAPRLAAFECESRILSPGRFLAMEYVLFTPRTRTLRSSSLESRQLAYNGYGPRRVGADSVRAPRQLRDWIECGAVW